MREWLKLGRRRSRTTNTRILSRRALPYPNSFTVITQQISQGDIFKGGPPADAIVSDYYTSNEIYLCKGRVCLERAAWNQYF